MINSENPVQAPGINLWQVFENSAAAAPDRPALIFQDDSISFGELAAAARTCAGWLATKGLRKGDMVGLQVPKRPETYILWLACLHQGLPYVFMDPRNPVSRTHAIVARLEPKLLVTTAPGPSSKQNEMDWQTYAAETLELPVAQDWRVWLNDIDTGTAPDPAACHGLDPAYAMFTSGSTGEPKGAVIPHQGVLSLMRWVSASISKPGELRFSNLNPLHFDNAVFDLYGGLINGSTLVPVETTAVANPALWTRRLRDGEANIIFAVPTLFQSLDRLNLLNPGRLPRAKVFVFGGEGYPVDDLVGFYDRFCDQARLVNVYGPTETSCICSSLELDREALVNAPMMFPSLGRMHPDFEYAIMDEQEPAKAGESGELWIGGANVGLGYYNNPEESARRFQQDPRQANFRSIWYRTGDLVREDRDGLLWFGGRVDNQVKIRGHRIELEEIDLAIESIPGITRAISVAVTGSHGQELRAAYATERPVAEENVREICKARLPTYMQPALFRQLDALPLNANGKVDRHAVKAMLGDGA